jgi:uncharacterized metal-binding protein
MEEGELGIMNSYGSGWSVCEDSMEKAVVDVRWPISEFALDEYIESEGYNSIKHTRHAQRLEEGVCTLLGGHPIGLAFCLTEYG